MYGAGITYRGLGSSPCNLAGVSEGGGVKITSSYSALLSISSQPALHYVSGSMVSPNRHIAMSGQINPEYVRIATDLDWECTAIPILDVLLPN